MHALIAVRQQLLLHFLATVTDQETQLRQMREIAEVRRMQVG